MEGLAELPEYTIIAAKYNWPGLEDTEEFLVKIIDYFTGVQYYELTSECSVFENDMTDRYSSFRIISSPIGSQEKQAL